MDDSTLALKLCRNFCSYYKPSNDEPACRGFLAVRHLVASGVDLPFTVESRRSGKDTEEMLRLKLCTPCAFEEQDCDFAGRRPDAPPCGGFLFLSRIVEEGVIAVDDIPNKF